MGYMKRNNDRIHDTRVITLPLSIHHLSPDIHQGALHTTLGEKFSGHGLLSSAHLSEQLV